MRMSGWITLAAGWLVFIVACGGGGETGPSASPTGAQIEDELAQSMVLTVEDFPRGWSEEPADADAPDATEQCRIPWEGATGFAETGNFENPSGSKVSQALRIFGSVERTETVVEHMKRGAECLVKVFNSGKLDDDEVAFSKATLGVISFPSIGDRSAAYRLKVHAKARKETGLFSEIDWTLDFVVVVVDRVAFVITAEEEWGSFDAEELESVARKAEARVRAAVSRDFAGPQTERSTSAAAFPSPTPTATPKPKPRLGESTEAEGSIYTVNAVDDPFVPSNSYSKPAAGNRFVAIDVTQEATASSDAANPLYFFLQDGQGYEYRPTWADREPSFSSGDLTAGQKRRGWVIFEVPLGTTVVSVLAQPKPGGPKVLIADLRQE